MRDLKTNDVFKMSRIIKKMALQIDTNDIKTEGKTQMQVGIELMSKLGMTVMQNLCMAQDDVNEFLGDLNGISGAEFGELPLNESMKLIMEFKEKVPTDFFKYAGKMK